MMDILSYVSNEEYRDRCARILAHYGGSLQLLKLGEEAGELSLACTRYFTRTTGLGKKEQVLEEIADCLVMIEQMLMSDLMGSGARETVRQLVEEKVERTLGRIEESARP